MVARDDLFVHERLGVGVEGADPAGEEFVDGVRDGDVDLGDSEALRVGLITLPGELRAQAQPASSIRNENERLGSTGSTWTECVPASSNRTGASPEGAGSAMFENPGGQSSGDGQVASQLDRATLAFSATTTTSVSSVHCSRNRRCGYQNSFRSPDAPTHSGAWAQSDGDTMSGGSWSVAPHMENRDDHDKPTTSTGLAGSASRPPDPRNKLRAGHTVEIKPAPGIVYLLCRDAGGRASPLLL